MAAAILFVGDMHLGRRPASLPHDLADHETPLSELTPAAAWRRVVRHAVEERVDAVVLAGDVVESENARFEAFGPLHDGVSRLVESGVAVFAVAGNHDVDALPRLARSVGGFRLLGRDGRWEIAPVLRDGRPVARLLGWSFPAPRHPTSPLSQADLPSIKDDDLPWIGVLHCDLSSSTSPHAPVTLAELERAAVDAWLLGHVHKPSRLAGPRPMGYLGSLVGLDPTEAGPHGPWIARLVPGHPVAVEQVPLAPLAWESIELDVARIDDPRGVDGLLRGEIERLHARLGSRIGATRAVGCRVVLTGRTSQRARLHEALARDDWTALRVRLGDVLYFVERVEDRSRSMVAPETLAGDDDPPALLAARLVALSRRDETARDLIRRARGELQRVNADRTWSLLDPAELDDERVRQLLLDAGGRALEALLAQEEDRPR